MEINESLKLEFVKDKQNNIEIITHTHTHTHTHTYIYIVNTKIKNKYFCFRNADIDQDDKLLSNNLM